MACGNRVEGGTESGGEKSPAEGEDFSAERRLEELAEEIGRVIVAHPAADREALHDYAVSLVRERLPLAEQAIADRDGRTGEGGGEEPERSGVGALGYGALLFLVGPFLFLIFPPVAVALMAVGALLVSWGLVAAVWERRPGADVESDG